MSIPTLEYVPSVTKFTASCKTMFGWNEGSLLYFSVVVSVTSIMSELSCEDLWLFIGGMDIDAVLPDMLALMALRCV